MSDRRADPIRWVAPVALAFVGGVFFLQGLGVPIGRGSFMIGDPTWSVIGGAMILVGGFLAWRRRPR
jgi:LPXTG-motif cell wall-anchored protein